MKMENIDILLISFSLISLMGITIFLVLLSFQAEEIELKAIKINQLEKELDNCNYLNKQILIDKYLAECADVNVYYGADKNTFKNMSEVFE